MPARLVDEEAVITSAGRRCQRCGGVIASAARNRRWCGKTCRGRAYWKMYGKPRRRNVHVTIDAYIALCAVADETGRSLSGALEELLASAESREELH